MACLFANKLHINPVSPADYPENPMQSGGIALNDIRARVAYLHGLAEGLDLDGSSAEGRVLTAMLDVMNEMAEQLIDVAEAQDELAEYVEDVDYDLGALEDSIYADDDEDDDLDEVQFIPEAYVVDEEDGVELVACPQCGETLAAGSGEELAGLDVVCPVCGCSMIEGDAEYDEDLVLEHD